MLLSITVERSAGVHLSWGDFTLDGPCHVCFYYWEFDLLECLSSAVTVVIVLVFRLVRNVQIVIEQTPAAFG